MTPIVKMRRNQNLQIAGGYVKWCSHLGKYFEVLQNVKHKVTIGSKNYTSRYIPKSIKDTQKLLHKCLWKHC